VSRDGDQPWRWPRRETWTAFIRYTLLLHVLWVGVYIGCSWLTAHRTLRVPLATSWDTRIPYVPEAAAVYLSLFPMIWLSPFILKSITALRDFAKSLAWLIVISGVGFLLLPADAPFDPRRTAGGNSALMSFADAINFDHNLCPSLHVGMAVVCAVVFSRHSGPMGIASFWIWAGAIAASTLLVREHYIVDVLAGVVVGCLVSVRVRGPVA
jgi:membrane-associated phospholipid phosphatase